MSRLHRIRARPQQIRQKAVFGGTENSAAAVPGGWPVANERLKKYPANSSTPNPATTAANIKPTTSRVFAEVSSASASRQRQTPSNTRAIALNGLIAAHKGRPREPIPAVKVQPRRVPVPMRIIPPPADRATRGSELPIIFPVTDSFTRSPLTTAFFEEGRLKQAHWHLLTQTPEPTLLNYPPPCK